jgi:hypothetical protein
MHRCEDIVKTVIEKHCVRVLSGLNGVRTVPV